MANVNFYYFGAPLDLDITNRYTYFDTLLNKKGNSSITRVHNNLAAQVHSIGNQYANNLDISKKGSAVQETINLLESICESERSKELAAVNNYLQEAKITNVNITDFQNDPNKFYLEITKYFTEMKKGIDIAKGEFEKIKTDTERHITGQASEHYIHNLTAAETILLNRFNQRGTAWTTKTFKDVTESPSLNQRLVNSVLSKIMNNNDLIKNFSKGRGLYDLSAALLADLMQYVRMTTQKSLNELQNDPELNNIINEYYEKRQTEQNSLFYLIDNAQNNIDRLKERIENFSPLTNATVDKNKPKHRHSRRTLKEAKKILGITTKMSQKQLDEILNNFIDIRYNKSKQSGGLTGELISVVTNTLNAKVPGNPATDAITVAQMDVEFIKNQKINPFEATAKIIDKYNKQMDKASAEEIRQYMLDMNNELEDLKKEILTLEKSKDKDNPQHVFMTHESIKFYTQIEDQTKNILHGRELTLNNFIGQFMAIADNEYAQIMINMDDLFFLMLNLWDGALLHSQKDIIEKYLALFVSVLMFSDSVNIIKDAVTDIVQQNQSIVNVHFYNINGKYVPASSILYYTLESLKNANNALMGATQLSINTSAPTTTINKMLAYEQNTIFKDTQEEIQNNWEQLWSEASAEVAENTKINFAFASGILNFFKNLSNLP